MYLQRLWLLGLLILAACSRTTVEIPPTVTETQNLPTTVYSPTEPATPSFHLLPTRMPGSPVLTPTPDAEHFSNTTGSDQDTHVVQFGETLGGIARRYGVSLEGLMEANQLTNPDALSVGQTLTLPHPTPQPVGPAFKIIPDSELVYGPMSITLGIDSFIGLKGGYLATYLEDIDFETLTGAQVILRVAQNYSVNPRLLLAVLEYRSGWVTNPNPSPETLTEPMGVSDGWHSGLYRQLTWTADSLNRGFYLWRVGGLTKWVLADGSVVPADPTINAGTAGVQMLFAGLDDYSTWLKDVSPEGLFQTYEGLFGPPFDLAIEPIVPPALIQPMMHLPFARGEVWAFTGGPHGGWDTGSAWAGLDFAPPGEAQGCVESDAWVTAVTDGLIIRSGDGAVVQDLDGDGFEQSGWTVLYMHIASSDRVNAGTFVNAGGRIGHPSCEGGISNGTHLHLARRLNGEWIPADGPVPFNLDGWISSGTGIEYDGFLTRDGLTVEAYDGNDPINQIQR